MHGFFSTFEVYFLTFVTSEFNNFSSDGVIQHKILVKFPSVIKLDLFGLVKSKNNKRRRNHIETFKHNKK